MATSKLTYEAPTHFSFYLKLGIKAYKKKKKQQIRLSTFLRQLTVQRSEGKKNSLIFTWPPFYTRANRFEFSIPRFQISQQLTFESWSPVKPRYNLVFKHSPFRLQNPGEATNDHAGSRPLRDDDSYRFVPRTRAQKATRTALVT